MPEEGGVAGVVGRAVSVREAGAEGAEVTAGGLGADVDGGIAEGAAAWLAAGGSRTGNGDGAAAPASCLAAGG